MQTKAYGKNPVIFCFTNSTPAALAAGVFLDNTGAVVVKYSM